MKYVELDKAVDEIANIIPVVGIVPFIPLESVIAVLDRLATTDVVEVVRCKDCRKWGNPHACPFGKRYMSLEDGYCYAGKRREDGEIH